MDLFEWAWILELLSCLRYEDGHLYWTKTVGQRAKAGKKAGTLSCDGYWRIKYHGKIIRAHILIWSMHNGPVPDGFQIDHYNRIKDDNRNSNLWLLTPRQNVLNSGVREDSSSGFKGVQICNDKWVSKLYYFEYYYGGLHENKKDAALAYDKLILDLGIEWFAFLNFSIFQKENGKWWYKEIGPFDTREEAETIKVLLMKPYGIIDGIRIDI